MAPYTKALLLWDVTTALLLAAVVGWLAALAGYPAGFGVIAAALGSAVAVYQRQFR